MNDQDKIGFIDMMNTLSALYSKPNLELDTIKVWYMKLQPYKFETVAKAFDIYVNQYTVMPSPADIIKICKQAPVEFTRLEAPKPHPLDRATQDRCRIGSDRKRFAPDVGHVEAYGDKHPRAGSNNLPAVPASYAALAIVSWESERSQP